MRRAGRMPARAAHEEQQAADDRGGQHARKPSQLAPRAGGDLLVFGLVIESDLAVRPPQLQLPGIAKRA